MKLHTALTIAGSDCSGGAGIQADLKTMTVNGVYAMSVITALTAQNTKGVNDILDIDPHFIQEQMDAVFTDIFPDAVKIGMLSNKEAMCVIAERLQHYQARNIVVDPVMVATSGSMLMKRDAVDTLKEKLLPMADLLTPNINEAEVLWEHKIHTEEDMMKAAVEIHDTYGCAVLMKGGHRTDCADDLLYDNGHFVRYPQKKIANPNTHGTGCTLSSAIAAYLSLGCDMPTAVGKAKKYINGAIAAMLDLGQGHGPLHHAYNIKKEEENI